MKESVLLGLRPDMIASLDNRLDLVLQLLNFVGKRAIGVPQHRRGDNVSGDATCPAQISLFGYVDIDHILKHKNAENGYNLILSNNYLECLTYLVFA